MDNQIKGVCQMFMVIALATILVIIELSGKQAPISMFF